MKTDIRHAGCAVQRAMLTIDGATASRLYLQCKAWAPSIKESTAREEAKWAILGVPCVIDFGFSSSRRNVGRAEIHACVWIFSSSEPDFFGSSYFPVEQESDALPILNSTIEHAIEQAKANKKFQEALAVKVGKN